MSKNAKIVVLLVIIFLVLAIYLMLSLKEVTVKTNVTQSREEYSRQVQEKLRIIEETYKNDLSSIFSDYDALINNPAMSTDEIVNGILILGDRIKNLTVPAQFKELHMNLFLAFTDAENINVENLDLGTTNISNLIKEAKATYPWLVK